MNLYQINEVLGQVAEQLSEAVDDARARRVLKMAADMAKVAMVKKMLRDDESVTLFTVARAILMSNIRDHKKAADKDVDNMSARELVTKVTRALARQK